MTHVKCSPGEKPSILACNVEKDEELHVHVVVVVQPFQLDT